MQKIYDPLLKRDFKFGWRASDSSKLHHKIHQVNLHRGINLFAGITQKNQYTSNSLPTESFLIQHSLYRNKAEREKGICVLIYLHESRKQTHGWLVTLGMR